VYALQVQNTEVLGLQRSQSRERSKIAGMVRQSANLQKFLLADRLFRPNFPYLANIAEPRRTSPKNFGEVVKQEKHAARKTQCWSPFSFKIK
jgi:hypothetical protein